jgi:hypothetical protein
VVSVGASLAIIEMLGEEGQTLVAEHALGEESRDRGMEQILSNRHRRRVVWERLLGARIGEGGLATVVGEVAGLVADHAPAADATAEERA